MPKKILIIEDDWDLIEIYNKKFTQANFCVICSLTSEEGLILAKKEQPDIILLDILLPKANGLWFLINLKKDKTIAHIPVIVFSNYENTEIKTKLQKMGIKEYLIKANCTPQKILKKVQFYLK